MLAAHGVTCSTMCCAVLCCAVLCCAVLCCAVLCCAVLCCAVLCCAVLCCAVLCLQDELTRYRAVLRSQNLFNKSHSTAHNIITGQPRHNTVAVPPAPTRAQQ
jgi:hypothetical protein